MAVRVAQTGHERCCVLLHAHPSLELLACLVRRGERNGRAEEFVDASLLMRAAAKPLSRPWWTLLLSVVGVVADCQRRATSHHE